MRLEVVALASWAVTATIGFTMAATWVTRGGLVKQPRDPQQALMMPPPYFNTPVVLTHLSCALGGLLVWGIYVLVDQEVLAWAALVLLLPVLLFGLSMFGRWIGSRRARLAGAYAAAPTHPVESRLPAPAVVLHGLLGIVTIVLVVTVTLGHSGS